MIESALPPQEIDLDFVQWLARNQVPFVLVFTKTDKVSVTVEANVAAFKEAISAWFQQPPAIFTCSAETGHGRHDLLSVIGENMTAIEAEQAAQKEEEAQASPGDPPSLSAKASRAKAPSSSAPW